MRSVLLFTLVLTVILLAVFLGDEGAVKEGDDLDRAGTSSLRPERPMARERTAVPDARLTGTHRPFGSLADASSTRTVLRGVVLDVEGNPSYGSVVQLWRWVPRTNSHGVQDEVMDRVGNRRSDASGRFTFSDLDPGAYWTTLLVPPGLLSRRLALDLAPAEEREITLSFLPAVAPRIEVRTEGGEPIESAGVSLYQGSQYLTGATTDAAGTATLWSVDPEWECRLEVSPPQASAETLLRAVQESWRPGDDTIVLKRALAVSGRVVDEKGVPVSRAVVMRRRPEDGEAWTRSETSTDGAFEFRGLRPGTMTFQAGPPGRAPPSSSPEVVARIGRNDVRLVVARGGTRTLRLTNALDPKVDVGDLQSFLLTPAGRPGKARRFKVQGDGTAEAMGLEEGVSYVLWGEYGRPHMSYVYATEVHASPEPLLVRVEEGGVITCTLRSPKEVGSVYVRLSGPGVQKRGTFRPAAGQVLLPLLEGATLQILGVPPGTWKVVALGTTNSLGLFEARNGWRAETTASAGDEITLVLKAYDER